MLDDRSVRCFLRSYRGRRILPAVAYTERGVHYRRTARFGRLVGALNAWGIEVEWYRPAEADRAIDRAVRTEAWPGHARDLMIGGHVHDASRIMVTNNKRDFDPLGDVMTPAEVMARFPTRSR